MSKFLNKTDNYQNSVPPKTGISVNINDKKGKIVSFSQQTSLHDIAQKKYEKQIQNLTDDQIKKIDEKVISKETEIMKI